MADWITAFMDYTEGIPSPEIFRLWAGIAAVSGALERRVWINTARTILYPHMYVLLVSPPGIGKSQAIVPIGDIWAMSKDIKVSPDNLTKASLIDALAKATRVIHPNGKTVSFNSMQVSAPELGVFLSAHDLEFLSVLNYIYDAPRRYREERRASLKEPIEISFPQMTILAGTQPGFLSSLLPDEAWSMGFCSRIFMIYAGTGPEVELFYEDEIDGDPTQNPKFKRLLKSLEPITGLYGPFQWEPDAKVSMAKFNSSHKLTDPDHSKLAHYNSRRVIHALKLSMVAAASERQELIIKKHDVERALDWMFAAEEVMPDIFREMSRKSDRDVLTELHRFIWSEYQKNKKPLHTARIHNFLKNHLPSERIMAVFTTAQKINMVERSAGTEDFWIPRPINEHGVE